MQNNVGGHATIMRIIMASGVSWSFFLLTMRMKEIWISQVVTDSQYLSACLIFIHAVSCSVFAVNIRK